MLEHGAGEVLGCFPDRLYVGPLFGLDAVVREPVVEFRLIDRHVMPF